MIANDIYELQSYTVFVLFSVCLFLKFLHTVNARHVFHNYCSQGFVSTYTLADRELYVYTDEHPKREQFGNDPSLSLLNIR